MSTQLTADQFIERLEQLRSPDQRAGYERAFQTGPGGYGESDQVIGVRMGDVFALAKEHIDMPPAEVERLLESPIHEARVGAMSIMDKQARRKRTPEFRRKELYELYLRRHDRIDNWDLVDLAAPHVIGGYLFDKPRDILYELARSRNVWERRSAMYATAYFVRQGQLDDTFAIAELLVNDEHDLIQKAVGGWLREAGKQDQARLLACLDRHAATMPRVALRQAIEKLDRDRRSHYLAMRAASRKA